MTEAQTRNTQYYLLLALLVLPFLSKVSFRFMGLPESFSYVFLQGGMHPILNSLLSVLLLAALFVLAEKIPGERTNKDRLYFTSLVALIALLCTQAVLQFGTGELPVPAVMHFSGTFLTCLLVAGYGWLVAGRVSAEMLFSVLVPVSRVLIVMSLLLFVLQPGLVFKGTRFVGVFKHIPYMVTCGQIGLLAEWYAFYRGRGRQRAYAVLFSLAALATVLLTGTRSAMICALIFAFVAAWKWPVLGREGLRVRALVGYLSAVFVITLGPFAYSQTEALLRGQSSFALRKAQDGISSRIEEVERGMASFNEKPVLGHGLMHRFASDNLENAGSYSSFRDPHNILVSAGVIGGWPMLVFIAAGLVALFGVLAFRILESAGSPAVARYDYPALLIAIYLFSHLPILLIYHMHFSLGGLADRYYWLLMGFVCRGHLPKEVET